MKSLLVAGLLAVPAAAQDAEAPLPRTAEIVHVSASDKLPVLAELHLANPDPTTPFLVLLHDSLSSRGEYRPMVPRLMEMGFNLLAVDLRVGGKCKEVKNATARASKGLPLVRRIDALRDIEAALEFARGERAHGKLILWGSAYSASLALVEAAQRPDLVDGVIAFAPGEYFQQEGQPATWVKDSASGLSCPVFITSDRGAEGDWRAIFEALPGPQKTSFLPETGGRHGSSSLWPEVKESEEYWKALTAFLDRSFPRGTPPPPPAHDDKAGAKKDG